MKVNIMIRSLKTTRYALLLLPFFQLSYANLTVETAQTIQGTLPRLSDELENNLKNTGELKGLFGLRINNKSYYGDKEIAQMPIPTAYPFNARITPAEIKQPNKNQFFDRDGDELDYLSVDGDISMVWYYTDANNNEVEFTPKDNDSFCSLANEYKYAPFKVKLSANLVLFSKYGDPNNNTYPNSTISTQPSVTYTILEDVGFCFARPELNPSKVGSSAKYQWNPKYGFLIQSNTDPSKNFPNTGFYGAKFDLLLSKDGITSDYSWRIKQGSELVSISHDANVVTVKFNTDAAKDPGKAWTLVMGSGKGYTVIIEGKNLKNDKIIQYAFTIDKWFDVWKQGPDYAPLIDKVQNVQATCQAKPGNYRLTYSEEISNALVGQKGDVQFTREIGKLLSEWGEATQESYPGSFGPFSYGKDRFARFYVWEPTGGKDRTGAYCDIHLDTGVYHCRKNLKEDKNGVCVSIPK